MKFFFIVGTTKENTQDYIDVQDVENRKVKKLKDYYVDNKWTIQNLLLICQVNKY